MKPQIPQFLDQSGLMRQAFGHFQSGRIQEAHAICLKVLETNPKNFDALQLLGGIALNTGNIQPALQLFSLAIDVRPKDALMYYNRALALERIKQFDAAIKDCMTALEINPNLSEVHYRLGILYSNQKCSTQSIKHYDQAIALKADLSYIYGSRLMEAMKICDWKDYADQIRHITRSTEGGLKVSPPFVLSALVPDPHAQMRSAQIWTQSEYPTKSALGPIPKIQPKEKIRVGYFSADFRNHPVSYLMAEVFECHDNSRFEIIAFSLSARMDEDSMQNRLRKAFSAFHDVPHLNDVQVAHFARAQQLDIAVDLGGHTDGGRFGIFAQRAAPVQVSYLGYLGTTGSNCIDYLVADRVLLPAHLRDNYVERVVYLPCYQANDVKSRVAASIPSRESFGIREDSFVFCCFNSIYKINPDVMDSWCRILRQCDESVLFLSVDDQSAKDNLTREFEERGVQTSQLVFGHGLPRPEFLARFSAADLFLDTWPCNGGTTSSEALFAGLPMVTLCGETFAGRMGASLLTALDVQELITHSPVEYEQRAIALYRDREKLKTLAHHIRVKSSESLMFDSKRFARHLEDAYTHMVSSYFSGKPAQDFDA
jgi:predicted O-linked N-acetylglucosamine transferase (SPINDLY family)